MRRKKAPAAKKPVAAVSVKERDPSDELHVQIRDSSTFRVGEVTPLADDGRYVYGVIESG